MAVNTSIPWLTKSQGTGKFRDAAENRFIPSENQPVVQHKTIFKTFKYHSPILSQGLLSIMSNNTKSRLLSSSAALLLALSGNQALAAGKITALNVVDGNAVFTTEEVKSHIPPGCITGDSEAWSVSTTANDGLYQLLTIANETGQAVEITSANACQSGIEEAGMININYSASGSEPVISADLNFVARSQVTTGEGVSATVSFNLKDSLGVETVKGASEGGGFYQADFGQLAAGDYSLTTKVTTGSGGDEETAEDVIAFTVSPSSNEILGDVEVPVAPMLATVPAEDTNSTAIGTLPGNFNVDESGAATYSVPLSLPQGIGGVTPQLALFYSSNGANGSLGMGWSISGLSSISRCRQTKEQDGDNQPLTLTNEDRFCFNGQKLIAVSGEYGADGTQYSTEIDSQNRIISYGTAGTGPSYFTVEGPDGSISYYGAQDIKGVRSDSLFAVNGTGVQWFISSTSDNFENSANSIIFNYLKGNDENGLGENEILISSIDYSGNQVSFNYFSESARTDLSFAYMYGTKIAPEALLDDITVTASDNTQIKRYKLGYEQDPYNDIQRINSIQECGINDVCTLATTFAWEDQKAYNLGTISNNNWLELGEDPLVSPMPMDVDNDGFSDLLYAKQIDLSNDNHQYDLYISYNQNGVLQAPTKVGYFHAFGEIPQLIPADIDGDGITEIVYNSGTGEYRSWWYFDFNNPTSTEVACTIEWCTGSWTLVTQSFNLGVLEADIGDKIRLHDINADGYPDMVAAHEIELVPEPSTGPVVQKIVHKVALNNKEGGFEAVQEVSVDTTSAKSQDILACTELPDSYNQLNGTVEATSCGNFTSSSNIIKSPSAPVDFNNDGVADFLLKVTDSFRVVTSQISGFNITRWIAVTLEEKDGEFQFVPFAQVRDQALYSANVHVGDINQDGLGDIIYEEATEDLTTELKYRLSTGTGFTEFRTIPIGTKGKLQSIQLVDINKDGKSDLFYFNPYVSIAQDSSYYKGRWQVSYFDGENFSQPESVFSTFEYDKDVEGVFAADWTGDGDLGIMRINYQDKRAVYNKDLRSNTAQQRITKITNGFGVETQINYDLLTNRGVYTRGLGADELTYGRGSPVFDLITPSHVVSEVISDAPGYVNGIYDADNTVSVSYKYHGYRAQSGGRGSLGFERITTYDPVSAVTTETLYQQDFPYTGMPKATISYLGEPQTDALADDGTTTIVASQRLGYARNTNAFHRLHGNSVYFPYLQQSEETQYSLNDAGTATTTISTVNTTNVYEVKSDNHTNLKTVTAITKDSAGVEVSKVITGNIYNDDSVDNWWLGRVSETTVTHHRADAYPAKDITRTTEFSYDADSGLLTTEITAPGLDNQLTTLHCYDSWGNETAAITHTNVGVISCDSKNITTDDDITKVFRRKVYSYDDNGRYLTQKGNDLFAAMERVESRNSLGLPTKTIDINGVVTNIGYDSFGKQYFTSNSLGQMSKTVHSYSTIGPAISHTKFVETTTGAGQATVIQYYDVMGRKIASAKQGFADNSWIIQQVGYDQLGQKVKESMPYYIGESIYWNETTLDEFGRPQSMVSADSNSTTDVKYEGLTRTTEITFNTPNGSETLTQVEVKNELGENATMQDAAEGTLSYIYNATGNLTKVIGVDGTEIVNTYDDWGRKIAMVDPDKGNWAYEYNALDEQVKQTSANNFVTRTYRDSIGRTIERNVSGTNVNDSTTYDYVVDTDKVSHLLQSESDKNQTKQYVYDGFGRATLLRTSIDGKTYSQQTTFDQYGRVFQKFDADATSLSGCIVNGTVKGTCWGIQNQYNSRGYLTLKKEARNGAANDATVYYQVTAMDALGNVSEFNQNDDKIASRKTFNQANGQLIEIVATKGGVAIQNNEYTFDGLGNLRSRTNHTLATNTQGQSETFQYDKLNRLTHINAEEQVKYFANGNIRWKKDVGSYCYNSARPHAVSGIGSDGCSTQSYGYDNNGNMTSGRDRTIGYSHFDKPVLITSSNGDTTSFSYGTNRARYKRVTTENVDGEDVTTTTYYLGNVEVESKSNSSVVVTRRMLPGAIELQRSNGTREISYLLKDHLGSLDTITDENGDIKQKLHFDAWGKKTVLDNGEVIATLQGFSTLSLSQLLDITKRGFTDHESVDHADIIHMNGRIYDPTLGRFLQADPFIQAHKNSQSYNRYSYVLNNPLSYTDPSGYFFKSVFKKLNKALGKFAPVFGIALMMIPGMQVWAAQSFWHAAAVGFGVGGVSTGSLKGALIGAFSGAVFHGIGQHFNKLGAYNATHLNGDLLTKFGGNYLTSGQIAGQIASHAVAGGVIADLAGGKFGHGFFSAGFSKAAMGSVGFNNSDTSGSAIAERVATAAVIGGTSSVISGGKFANGASTAAMAQLFNAETSNLRRQEALKKEIGWVLRALTPEQRKQYDMGIGIYARNRAGTVTPDEHVGKGSSVAGDSPWISTTTQEMVVDGYKSEAGVVWIDLTKVPGEIVKYDTIGKVWANDLNFYQKLAYHRSAWAEEVLIKGHVPQEAMTLIHDGKR